MESTKLSKRTRDLLCFLHERYRDSLCDEMRFCIEIWRQDPPTIPEGEHPLALDVAGFAWIFGCEWDATPDEWYGLMGRKVYDVGFP